MTDRAKQNDIRQFNWMIVEWNEMQTTGLQNCCFLNWALDAFDSTLDQCDRTAHGPQQAAADDLERAMKIEPNEPNAVLLMGQAYKAMGKLAQAVQMMTIARDLDPKNGQKINRMIETFKAESAKTTSGTLGGTGTGIGTGTGGYRGAAGTTGATGAGAGAVAMGGNLNLNPVQNQNRGGMLAGAGGYAGGPGYGYGYAASGSASLSLSFDGNGSADISMDSS